MKAVRFARRLAVILLWVFILLFLLTRTGGFWRDLSGRFADSAGDLGEQAAEIARNLGGLISEKIAEVGGLFR